MKSGQCIAGNLIVTGRCNTSVRRHRAFTAADGICASIKYHTSNLLGVSAIGIEYEDSIPRYPRTDDIASTRAITKRL